MTIINITPRHMELSVLFEVYATLALGAIGIFIHCFQLCCGERPIQKELISNEARSTKRTVWRVVLGVYAAYDIFV
jgi:hypothetical protein